MNVNTKNAPVDLSLHAVAFISEIINNCARSAGRHTYPRTTIKEQPCLTDEVRMYALGHKLFFFQTFPFKSF